MLRINQKKGDVHSFFDDYPLLFSSARLILGLIHINIAGIIIPSSPAPMKNQASISWDIASRLANRIHSSGGQERVPSLQGTVERPEKELILGAYTSLKSSCKVADYLSISRSAADGSCR